MGKFWVSSSSSSSSSLEFWHQSTNGGYATLLALIIIIIYHLISKTRFGFFAFAPRFLSFPSSSSSSSSSSPSAVNAVAAPGSYNSQTSRVSEIVSDADLKFLIDSLDEKLVDNEKWENVIDKKNNLISYTAKCCRPKDGPLKYLSVTVFENCSPEILRDFYMDNDYRMQWDKTLVEHNQLQLNKTNGTEIGRMVKKFPLLTPREYVLAWRLWEGRDRSFYCFVKECEHPLAPQHRKYVRIRYFRSGWCIRQVPGRDACEIKMYHQEDASLNMEMAKLAFAKGIWSYVRKMDNALHKYTMIRHPQATLAASAVTLIQKLPLGLEAGNSANSSASPEGKTGHGSYNGEAKAKKLTRRPSKQLLANGLLLLGGVICLSRGHSALGAKVAMVYILSKLHKRGTSSGQTGKS